MVKGNFRADSSGHPAVVHLIDHLGAGGAQVLLSHVLPRIAALGWKPAVIALKPGEFARRLGEATVPVRIIGATALNLPFRLGAVVRAVAEFRPAIVHAHLEVSTALVPFVARKTRAHSIVHAHVSEIHGRPLHRTGFIWGARRAEAVIAVSKLVAQAVEKMGVGRSKIHVVYNGIDTQAVAAAQPSSVRANLGLPPTAPLAITVGRLTYQKGIDVLLNAWSHVADQAGAHLLIVGDGPLRSRLEAQAQALGLSSTVHFLGLRHDVPSLLKSADVFVLASRWEGLPVVLIEAAAAGLPAVATSVSGVPEIVVDGETGILVPPEDVRQLADAVLGLLKDPAARRAMAEAARARAQKLFDASSTAAGWATVYRQLTRAAPADT